MNRSLRGEYHKAVINIKSQEKDTPYGPTYVMRPKLVRLITDEIEAGELKVESQRLLGAPIPLPEGRPEDEPEPLGFTPKGTPFFSEEEKDKLLAEEAKKAQEGVAQPEVEEKAEPIVEKKPGDEPPVEPPGEPVIEKKPDLDF
ncbi:unnamed protein product [marine sediment metagenome]|uniref:Uncharacterized protein n=1 Tax=marine sediment metagenome TaxID=412755 RepID=X1PDK3_9ZZZZ